MLFFDVRDSATPRYGGKITATEVGLIPFNRDNGSPPARSSEQRQIAAASLVRSPKIDEWTLVWQQGMQNFAIKSAGQ